jgi:threonine aldolase
VALGIDARELTQYSDSVTFCLSKGLSAPIGSLLCGSTEFVEKARAVRKMLGGGMRQVGWIASAGIVALETQVARLAEDHRNARILAEALAKIDGITIDLDRVHTNLVFFDVDRLGTTAREFALRLAEAGVRCNATSPSRIRMVTHRGITRDDVEHAAQVCTQLARSQPVAAGA